MVSFNGDSILQEWCETCVHRVGFYTIPYDLEIWCDGGTPITFERLRECGEQLGECVCEIKVRFTSVILLTKNKRAVVLHRWWRWAETEMKSLMAWLRVIPYKQAGFLVCVVSYNLVEYKAHGGIILGGFLARIANNSLKRVRTGGIPHSLVTLGLCYVTYQPLACVLVWKMLNLLKVLLANLLFDHQLDNS